MAKERKVKKSDVFIDMTAMSDMMVLLLTFFMLTATFLPMEPVQVTTPQSVSETKIVENSALNILIDPSGKVFINFSDDWEVDKENKVNVLKAVGSEYNVAFTDRQIVTFRDEVTHVGVPVKMLPAFLDLDASRRNEEIKKYGVPMDSVDNQLKSWVRRARAVNKEYNISIKADQTTAFPKVDVVMKSLVDIKENRFSLITTLKGMPQGF